MNVAHSEYKGEISSDEPAHPLPLQPNCKTQDNSVK